MWALLFQKRRSLSEFKLPLSRLTSLGPWVVARHGVNHSWLCCQLSMNTTNFIAWKIQYPSQKEEFYPNSTMPAFNLPKRPHTVLSWGKFSCSSQLCWNWPPPFWLFSCCGTSTLHINLSALDCPKNSFFGHNGKTTVRSQLWHPAFDKYFAQIVPWFNFISDRRHTKDGGGRSIIAVLQTHLRGVK